MRIGKAFQGTKWHILRSNNLPLCGYTSFVWLRVGFEEREIAGRRELKHISLCKNCWEALRKKEKKEKGRRH